MLSVTSLELWNLVNISRSLSFSLALVHNASMLLSRLAFSEQVKVVVEFCTAYNVKPIHNMLPKSVYGAVSVSMPVVT